MTDSRYVIYCMNDSGKPHIRNVKSKTIYSIVELNLYSDYQEYIDPSFHNYISIYAIAEHVTALVESTKSKRRYIIKLYKPVSNDLWQGVMFYRVKGDMKCL